MSLYMRATDITGDVTANHYRQWILIDSLHYGAQRPVHTPVGEVQRRSFGCATFTDFEITKQVCSASDDLWLCLCHNKSISEVNIHQCINDTHPIIEIKLNNVYLTQHNRYLVYQNDPYERITLNYVTISMTYIKHHSDGETATPKRTEYDLQTGR